MALNPDRIDAEFYDALRRHYTDEEIVELGAFIGFNIGYHTFFGSLKFYPMFAPDGRLVSQEESARIYGDVPVSLQSAHISIDGDTPRGGPSREQSTVPRQAATSHQESSVDTHTRSPGENPAAQSGPHIAPMPVDRIENAELRELIERGFALGVPDALFSGILACVSTHALAVLRALLVSHFEGNVDHRLKEIIRIKLARIAGDGYFAALRSRRARESGLDEATIEAGCGQFERGPRFSEAEKWALRYAGEMYRNPEKIDTAFYAEGKRHYSEAGIMELGAFIAFHYGMQAFARTLAIPPPAAR